MVNPYSVAATASTVEDIANNRNSRLLLLTRRAPVTGKRQDDEAITERRAERTCNSKAS